MYTKLSSRELEVATLLGQGHHVDAVASHMGLSRHTVNSHVTNAAGKVRKLLLPGIEAQLPESGHRPKIVLLYRYAWHIERPKAIFDGKQYEVLTPRESELASKLALGHSVHQASKKMGITTSTANTHIELASKKLNDVMSGRTDFGKHSRIYILVRYAFDRGLTKDIFIYQPI